MRRGLLVLLLALLSCGKGPPDKPGVFVLGVDGMDPVILERLMKEGKMPNFKRMSESGSFSTCGNECRGP